MTDRVPDPREEDPASLYRLAWQRLAGEGGGRDLEGAHRLLDRAVAAGHGEAVRLKAILLANGTGAGSDPERGLALLRSIKAADPYAAVQVAMIGRMSEAMAADRPVRERLSASPLIEAARGVLSAEECRYVRTLAEPALQPSVVVDPATGRRVPHPVRTSSGMSFGPTAEDLVIHGLNRRLASLTGTRVEQGEPLHVLRYAPGEQYRPHVDYLPGVANQRVWTVLLYLNDDYEGGATRFDRLGKEFRGQAGDALLFRNLDAEGRPDPDSRHAGRPVTRGMKWLATRWIRQRPYHPWTQPD